MQYICCSPLENYIQTKNIYIPKGHEHEYLLCAHGDTLELSINKERYKENSGHTIWIIFGGKPPTWGMGNPR
jgi:hypothetical protein